MFLDARVLELDVAPAAGSLRFTRLSDGSSPTRLGS